MGNTALGWIVVVEEVLVVEMTGKLLTSFSMEWSTLQSSELEMGNEHFCVFLGSCSLPPLWMGPLLMGIRVVEDKNLILLVPPSHIAEVESEDPIGKGFCRSGKWGPHWQRIRMRSHSLQDLTIKIMLLRFSVSQSKVVCPISKCFQLFLLVFLKSRFGKWPGNKTMFDDVFYYLNSFIYCMQES